MIYNNGVVIGKYREGDKKTIQAVKQEVSHDEVKRVIKNYYESEINILNKDQLNCVMKLHQKILMEMNAQ
ncbi:hypothetical protein KPL35_08905 [Clostridium sp. CF011]|uniref:hypothetical protein n=1 Tax=Clostridium sp. CF011 TaxID=2843318 RepID=UPI001C0D9754|nr:hypothetical protein [Clostridium sp. CF011]MBU3092195.1 hypothetical protein [Clostridium sp. CF011]WAG70329.1 hypothetical protein LL036_02460 [Clostridium sp. CF011]